MKLIYITSKKFPSGKVEPFIIKSMAIAFAGILDINFTLFIRGRVPPDFSGMNTVVISIPERFKAFLYFFALPIRIFRNQWNSKDVVFFSSDPYLLAILIFWRRLLRFRYRICSEWHQLFDDWRDRYVANGSDFLISTSKTLKHFISLRCDIDPVRIHVPYGGIDEKLVREGVEANKSEYRRRLHLPENVFLVGYAGAYKAMSVVEKGVAAMIQSLAYVDKDVVMYFVGGTKNEIDEYSELARQEEVVDRCVFVGKQPFNTLVEYERAMDILVIANPDTPYFRNYCFPFKSWEYLASGRPIVYSDLEIIEEILGKRGTAFRVGDPSSLAKAITSVRADMKIKEKLSKKNLEDLRAYTWQARAQSIIDFIKE